MKKRQKRERVAFSLIYNMRDDHFCSYQQIFSPLQLFYSEIKTRSLGNPIKVI